MNDPKYKDAAFAFAETIPSHLGRPTTPPMKWSVTGTILRIITADGRGPFYAPLSHFTAGSKGPKIIAEVRSMPIAPELMALPARDPSLPPANLKPDGKKKPAVNKAGK
jgi:hypothetical protein